MTNDRERREWPDNDGQDQVRKNDVGENRPTQRERPPQTEEDDD